jgi:hypothetical protein
MVSDRRQPRALRVPRRGVRGRGRGEEPVLVVGDGPLVSGERLETSWAPSRHVITWSPMRSMYRIYRHR